MADINLFDSTTISESIALTQVLTLSVSESISVVEYATKSPLNLSVSDTVTIQAEVLFIGWNNVVWSSRGTQVSGWDNNHREAPGLWSPN